MGVKWARDGRQVGTWWRLARVIVMGVKWARGALTHAMGDTRWADFVHVGPEEWPAAPEASPKVAAPQVVAPQVVAPKVVAPRILLSDEAASLGRLSVGSGTFGFVGFAPLSEGAKRGVDARGWSVVGAPGADETDETDETETADKTVGFAGA